MRGVLVVDDEAPVREAIVALGDWAAFDLAPIVESSNAAEALRLFDAEPSVGIVLTDMRMPQRDGAWLLSELSSREREYAAIVISGYTDFAYTRQAIRYQAIDYILKPIDPDDLNSALASAVAALDGHEGARPEPQPRADSLVEGVKAYVEESFASALSLEGIASRFSISREHLCRRFKQSSGVNLFEYIARRRVESAKELLASTDMPVKWIAEETGFMDEHYFSKAFKKWTGETPSAFRLRSAGQSR